MCCNCKHSNYIFFNYIIVLCENQAAALLVYDVTSNETFDRVTKWVKELQQMAPGDITMTIAANKSDLVRSNKIDIQEAER